MNQEFHLTIPITGAKLLALMLKLASEGTIDKLEQVSPFWKNLDGEDVAEWLIVLDKEG